MEINSVLDPIDTSDLGMTLMHDHITGDFSHPLIIKKVPADINPPGKNREDLKKK